jgi:hypothetical protein
MLCPPYSPWLNHSNFIWRRTHVMKLLIKHFSPISSTFAQNILLSTMFSNAFSLCSSFNVRDQVSHSYRITRKVTALCILIFTILNSSNRQTPTHGNNMHYEMLHEKLKTIFCLSLLPSRRYHCNIKNFKLLAGGLTQIICSHELHDLSSYEWGEEVNEILYAASLWLRRVYGYEVQK